MPAAMMRARDPDVAALAESFRSVEGVPAPTAMPQGQGAELAPILAALSSGQMSPEALIALLTALTGFGAGGVNGVAGQPMQSDMGPIGAAMGGY